MSWFWFWWLITLLMIVVDGAWWVVAMRLTKRRLWWVLVSVFIGAQLAAHLSACGQEIDFPPPDPHLVCDHPLPFPRARE